MKKIVVTISQPVHIGEDEWKQHRVSMVFSTSKSIEDMFEWVRSEGIMSPFMSDLAFSDYGGESLCDVDYTLGNNVLFAAVIIMVAEAVGLQMDVKIAGLLMEIKASDG